MIFPPQKTEVVSVRTTAGVFIASLALALLIEGCGGGDKPKPPPAPPVPDKVGVEIFVEAGSTASQLFMFRALRGAVTAPGVVNLMNLSMYSFGDAFYETEEEICGKPNLTSYSWGSWPGYDDLYRKCWDQKCGRESVVLGDACFVSGPYCKHGASECAVNLLEMCGKQEDQSGSVDYVHLAMCLERKYERISNSVKSGTEPNMKVLSRFVENCARDLHLDARRVLQCFATVRNLGVMAETAKQTVEHTKIPWITVTNKTGVPMVYSGDLPRENFLTNAVCKAWEFNGGDISVLEGCHNKMEIAI